jgi:hypothetical protein
LDNIGLFVLIIFVERLFLPLTGGRGASMQIAPKRMNWAGKRKISREY